MQPIIKLNDALVGILELIRDNNKVGFKDVQEHLASKALNVYPTNSYRKIRLLVDHELIHRNKDWTSKDKSIKYYTITKKGRDFIKNFRNKHNPDTLPAKIPYSHDLHINHGGAEFLNELTRQTSMSIEKAIKKYFVIRQSNNRFNAKAAITKLAARGHVHVALNPTDGVEYVRLTEKGQRALNSYLGRHGRIVGERKTIVKGAPQDTSAAPVPEPEPEAAEVPASEPAQEPEPENMRPLDEIQNDVMRLMNASLKDYEIPDGSVYASALKSYRGVEGIRTDMRKLQGLRNEAYPHKVMEDDSRLLARSYEYRIRMALFGLTRVPIALDQTAKWIERQGLTHIAVWWWDDCINYLGINGLNSELVCAEWKCYEARGDGRIEHSLPAVREWLQYIVPELSGRLPRMLGPERVEWHRKKEVRRANQLKFIREQREREIKEIMTAVNERKLQRENLEVVIRRAEDSIFECVRAYGSSDGSGDALIIAVKERIEENRRNR